MKNYILLGLLLFLLTSIVFANTVDTSFSIEAGNKEYQIGCKEIDGVYVSPRSITERNGNIYILDTANFKVNVYSRAGQFKTSYKIPSNNKYYNLVVDSKEKIYLLSKQGIYIITDKSGVKKLHLLPGKMSFPYDAYVDNKGNITINGDTGSWIIDTKGNFKKINDDGILLTQTGLIGQYEDDYLIIEKNGTKISKSKINADNLLLGFSESSVYYILPPKNGLKIRKVDSNGKVTEKAVKYDFDLISAAESYPYFFRVTPRGEVVMLGLDSKAKKFKVSIVNF